MVGGKIAVDMEEWTVEEVQESVMEILRKIFGRNIPEPVDIMRSKWSRDPFSFGSYSHIPPGASVIDRDLLAKPVRRKLLFAGEATQAAFTGTAHGSIMSGYREFRRIMSWHNVQIDR